MTCNVFLAGNSEVSLELQCFTAELITYIVCESNAPEGSQLEISYFYFLDKKFCNVYFLVINSFLRLYVMFVEAN